MRRRLVAVATGLALLMSLFGYGVYAVLGHFRRVGNSAATAAPVKPVDVKPALTLPGTLYLAQQGDLYALSGTSFRQVLRHDDAHGSWTQPAALAGGMLVVVGRQSASSALWQVAADGTIAGQLIGGAASTLPDGTLVNNHWFFYPRLGPDGQTLWFSYDSPKNGYLIDLAAWAMPVPTPATAPSSTPGLVRPVLPRTATRWSDPYQYTGGDVEPVPLASGGVLFTRYSFDDADHIHSQIWWARTALAGGTALTDAAQDCAQPALSPDGTEIAMVCTDGDQVSRLVVAPFSSGATPAATPTPTTAPRGTRPAAAATPSPQIGPQRVVVDGTLAAQPVWAPDGTGLAYLAPSETGANFQLWWIPGRAAALTAAPQQVTQSVGFDATSRPLWLAS